MPRATANGIEIEYETFGALGDLPLLLINGLGGQMLGWDEEFCELLVSHGFHVIRYDNRDVGMSTRLDAAPVPTLADVIAGKVAPPYSLEDMADDAAGLLRALRIPAAHIAGASMGGFIAQLLALNHPEMVLSMTVLISGPAWREGAPAKQEALAVLAAPPAATHEHRVAQSLAVRRFLIGTGDPFDEEQERRKADRALRRAFYPQGSARQGAAVFSAAPWLSRLSTLQVPALVIGGVEDPLAPIENSRMIARAIVGSRLIEVEGMGHDVPRRIWTEVADGIAEMAQHSTSAC